MSDVVTTTTPSSLDELQAGMELQGKVKKIELFGAFVDVGVGKDGLLHISQLGKPNVREVTEVVNEGETITVYVLKVDREAGRIALSLEKPPAIAWETLKVGGTVTGTVVRLEKFGAFVDIGAERPGMIHVSELASGYVNSPEDVVKVGDEITAQIISVNRKKRRIDLSIKQLEEPKSAPEPTAEEEDVYVPTAMELALRKAMNDTDMPFPEPTTTERRGKNNKRERREKRERQHDLEDIYERTLRGSRR